MSELAKTSTYIGVALLISALAFFTRPGSIGLDPPDMQGQVLFKDFEDPYDARRMQIVRYDEGLGQMSEFEVAQEADRWVIPSHHDYPADAQEQLKDAATALVGLTVVGVPSDRSGDHSLYGVLQPDPETTTVGEQGVGTLIAMSDADGNDLAKLIIGKEVKDTEDQHYARVPGQDQIYTVSIDPEKFSTKFEDWIEKDLLDLSSFDIQQIALKDYSLNVGLGGSAQYEQRLEMGVTWNADDFKWELDQLNQRRDGQLQPAELGDDEELNKETLDALKDALDELKIVDVERKPDGLRTDLQADSDFMSGAEAQQSLGSRGFYVVMVGPDQRELLSSDGEVLVRTKDGVEYVLRFGGYARPATGSDGNEAQLNRYVFVTTRVHEDSFPPPEYEALPGDEGEPSPPTPLSQTDDPSTSDTTEPALDAADETADEGQDAEEPDASPAPAEPSTTESDDPGSSEEKSTDEAAADTGDEGDSAEVDPDAAGDGQEADVEDERDRIIKENERKRKEYEEKRKKAEDKVRDLNFRFADWYYVISEDVYKKIHLGRSDVVKKKEKTDQEDEADQGFDIDAFRQIEEDGLTPAENDAN